MAGKNEPTLYVHDVDPAIVTFDTTSDPHTITLSVSSNTLLKQYETSDPTTIFRELKNPGVKGLALDLCIEESNPVNGTMGCTSHFKVTFLSECHRLDEYYGERDDDWWWVTDSEQLTMAAGTNIRDPSVQFRWPIPQPPLYSGEDVYERCGGLTYGCTPVGCDIGPGFTFNSYTLPDNAFITNAKIMFFQSDDSLVVSQTPPYEKVWSITLLASLVNKQTYDLQSVQYSKTLPSFKIRDYCLGMTLTSYNPEVEIQDPSTLDVTKVTSGSNEIVLEKYVG